MCDTALGLTTQSKLTVQAPGFGERGSSGAFHAHRLIATKNRPSSPSGLSALGNESLTDGWGFYV
ncbi:hypothetical protein [Desulfosporosinus sp. BG]|uniref:hypothetical protein n=1 Tax=Desulfosporosinus sp. BG TaxID=1633135 RepID=UPI00114CA766|nr:hypothetical protein [Desulfosporosinus sp. BG]